MCIYTISMKKPKSKALTRRIHIKISPLEFKNLVMLATSKAEGNISLYLRQLIKMETLLFKSREDLHAGKANIASLIKGSTRD